MNLKRRRRERQKERHERMRESGVEGGLREKEGGERNRGKSQGRDSKLGRMKRHKPR